MPHEGDPRTSREPSASSPSLDNDRRLSDRFDVTWAVDCETDDTFLYASIANISAMGIFVRTTDPLAVGTEVRLRFTPPSAPDGFMLRGLVQWVNSNVRTSPNPGMGIRFTELTADDRERIVEVIRTIAYIRDEPPKS